MAIYKVIGIMSGTSMDGVDLAYCELTENNGKWSYEIIHTETTPYDNKWRIRLSQLRKQPAFIYPKTDNFYGMYLGNLVNDFIKKYQINPDFISSHGHTIFHQPENGFTAQVGSGAAINSVTNLPVVNDFRTANVTLGGQGAPLVPIGDEMLFSEYDAVLNLGGIANISYKKDGKRLAYDICPANIVFNRVARNLNLNFDEGGQIAAKGGINYELLKILNNIPFYKKSAPKSLGREWINSEFWPEIRDFTQEIKQEDLMKTLSDHIAGQISEALYQINDDPSQIKVLVTGGGAYNDTLMELIQTHCDAQLIIPENTDLINFKEAMIFAFLGVLRLRNETNVMASYTGATADSVSGALFGDFSQIKHS